MKHILSFMKDAAGLHSYTARLLVYGNSMLTVRPCSKESSAVVRPSPLMPVLSKFRSCSFTAHITCVKEQGESRRTAHVQEGAQVRSWSDMSGGETEGVKIAPVSFLGFIFFVVILTRATCVLCT